jgi:O-antigen/teichoic acid export membrane protein
MTRLYKNFALLTASNLLSPLFSMVLVLAISRLQGVEMLGKYSLMMTVFVIGQSCAPLGLPIIVTREVARAHRQAGRYFMASCAVTTAVVLLVVGAAAGTLPMIMQDAPVRVAVELVLLSLVPTVVIAYGEAVLLAFERAADFVALNLAENVVRSAIGTGIVFFGGGIVGLAIALLAVRTATSIAFVILLRRRAVELSARIDRRLCGALLRYVPVLGAIPMINALYARADVLLLTWLGTWSDVGLYSAGLRLVDIARSVPPAYARALYPVLSRLRLNAPEEFQTVARRAIRNILLLVVPMALVLCAWAKPIIAMLYGESLAGASTSLQVLAWVLVPMALATTLAQMLFAADKQVIDLRVNVLATVVSVAAGTLLVPKWGAVGAAVAVLSSASVYAALQYVFVCQAVTPVSAAGQMAKLFAIAAATALLMLLMRGANPVMAAVAGLIAYAGGLALARVITRGDLDRARGSLAGLTGVLR